MSPQRIQQRRTRGWRMPPGAAAVTRPGRWGNPFRVARAPGGGPYEIRYSPTSGDDSWVGERDTEAAARADAVAMFAAALRDGALLITADQVAAELAGRDLACWCPPGPCHAEVLLAVSAGEDVAAVAELMLDAAR